MAKQKRNAVKSFKPKKFEDFEIVDAEQHTVGWIRVQPSAVKWAPKDAKVWYAVLLDKFTKFMEANGTRTKK